MEQILTLLNKTDILQCMVTSNVHFIKYNKGAGFQGRDKIAKILIEHGINPSDMHKDGFTPIHRASWGQEKRHRYSRYKRIKTNQSS